MAVDGGRPARWNWPLLWRSAHYRPARPDGSPLRVPVWRLFRETFNLIGEIPLSFQASDLTARIGEYDFRVQSSSERDYSVERFVMHENYERKTIQNDIALLKLNSKVKFSADVSPVCLPDRQMQVEEQNAYVTGKFE